MKCEFEMCRKKLTLVDRNLACRCGGRFCARHRFFSSHKCIAKVDQSNPSEPKRMKSSAHHDSSNMAF